MNFSANINTKVRMEEIKHQMSIHRQNLLCVCRLAIKSLIAKAQYQAIDDSCPEFKNFATIMEHILSHRLKGQVTWFGLEEPRDFWHFIRAVCGNTQDGCINNIVHMESVRSPKAKGRAWLRIALMEKRLGEHIATALHNDKALRAFYGEGAFLRSREAQVLVESLETIHSLDFSCCVKGEKLETGVASVIDYAQYLRFQMSDEEDQEGLMEDHQSPRGVKSTADDKLSQLQGHYRAACAQKNYMEDIANQKELQLTDGRRKIQTLEAMVTHLQEQVASLKEAQLISRRELEEHLIAGQWQLQERIRPSSVRTDQDEIALDSISSQHSPVTPNDQSSVQSFDPTSSIHQRSISPMSSCSGLSSTTEGGGDSNRPNPYSIPRLARREKEETASLIALAGSFTSQMSAISVRSTETNSSGISENQPHVIRTLSPDSLSAVSFASAAEASPMLS